MLVGKLVDLLLACVDGNSFILSTLGQDQAFALCFDNMAAKYFCCDHFNAANRTLYRRNKCSTFLLTSVLNDADAWAVCAALHSRRMLQHIGMYLTAAVTHALNYYTAVARVQPFYVSFRCCNLFFYFLDRRLKVSPVLYFTYLIGMCK